MTKGKFALGALIGAVAGVIAGVLTAPKSGKASRADLKTKASELKDQAAGQADTLRSKIADTTRDVQAGAQDLKERAVAATKGAKDGFDKKK